MLTYVQSLQFSQLLILEVELSGAADQQDKAVVQLESHSIHRLRAVLELLVS